MHIILDLPAPSIVSLFWSKVFHQIYSENAKKKLILNLKFPNIATLSKMIFDIIKDNLKCLYFRLKMTRSTF